MKIIFCKKCNNFHEVRFNCSLKKSESTIHNLNSLAQKTMKCNICNGTGNLSSSKKVYLGFADGKYPCPKCKGTGKVINFNG